MRGVLPSLPILSHRFVCLCTWPGIRCNLVMICTQARFFSDAAMKKKLRLFCILFVNRFLYPHFYQHYTECPFWSLKSYLKFTFFLKVALNFPQDKPLQRSGPPTPTRLTTAVLVIPSLQETRPDTLVYIPALATLQRKKALIWSQLKSPSGPSHF